MRVVKAAVNRVNRAARTENPVLVRLRIKVEKGIGEHAIVIQRHRVVPTGGHKPNARHTIVKQIKITAVLKHEPLCRVNARLDIIAVL